MQGGPVASVEKSKKRVMIIQLPQDFKAVKGLASEVRLKILEILRTRDRNVNEITQEMGLPQSTVATNIMILEEAHLIETRNAKAFKGTREGLRFPLRRVHRGVRRAEAGERRHRGGNAHRVVHRLQGVSPRGMCSPQKIIGFLDTPAPSSTRYA